MCFYDNKSSNLYGSTFKGSEVKIFRCPATVKGLRLRTGATRPLFCNNEDGKARMTKYP